MIQYNYEVAMVDDIIDYITDNDILNTYEGTDLEEDLNEMLWAEDEITGNGAYGYTDDIEKLQCFIGTNLPLAFEALENFDESLENLPREYKLLLKYVDTTIRCYLLRTCIDQALERLENIK